MSIVKSLVGGLINFCKSTPDSIQGYVNPTELIRVVFMSIAAGGGASIMLAGLNESLNTILIKPADVAIGSAVLVAVMEIQRRLQHGKKPVVIPFESVNSEATIQTPKSS